MADNTCRTRETADGETTLEILAFARQQNFIQCMEVSVQSTRLMSEKTRAQGEEVKVLESIRTREPHYYAIALAPLC